MSVTDAVREMSISELLLWLEVRLGVITSNYREIDSRLTWIENELRRKPWAGSASVNGHMTSSRSPEQTAREYAVLAALEGGPQTLTAIARAVYSREPEDRETQAVYRTLQRLIKDGRVTCDLRRYALVEERDEAVS